MEQSVRVRSSNCESNSVVCIVPRPALGQSIAIYHLVIEKKAL
uniref:Uncharacterized protein n=1 Tax=Ascaris lumbricoides TaxID=6252 RepID=A0A0M3IF75_ASCLU